MVEHQHLHPRPSHLLQQLDPAEVRAEDQRGRELENRLCVALRELRVGLGLRRHDGKDRVPCEVAQRGDLPRLGQREQQVVRARRL